MYGQQNNTTLTNYMVSPEPCRCVRTHTTLSYFTHVFDNVFCDNFGLDIYLCKHIAVLSKAIPDLLLAAFQD